MLQLMLPTIIFIMCRNKQMKQTVSLEELIVLQVETDRYTDKGNKAWWVKWWKKNAYAIMGGSHGREWWIFWVNSFETDVISIQSSFLFPWPLGKWSFPIKCLFCLLYLPMVIPLWIVT